MENRVRLGLKKLLNIAHDDTGQGRRVANFLLAWWNAEAHGGVDIAEPVCRGSRGVQGHGHRVHLARARGRRLPRSIIAARSTRSSRAGDRSRREEDGSHDRFSRSGPSACAVVPGRVRRSGA
ncbi:DUF7673 family protein [Sinorhizobium meliloti]